MGSLDLSSDKRKYEVKNIWIRKIISSILLLIGFSLVGVIFYHYTKEFYPGARAIGILREQGVLVRYPFLMSVVSFLLVVILNRKRFWTLLMFLAILGLVVILVPFLLYFLFMIFVYFKNI